MPEPGARLRGAVFVALVLGEAEAAHWLLELVPESLFTFAWALVLVVSMPVFAVNFDLSARLARWLQK